LGSLGKASRAVGVAQPALGRQVQLLETELGTRLFDRVSKGMRLTGEGEYLVQALDRPLRQIDLALSNVRNFTTRVETSVSIGMPPVIAQLLAPRVLARLTQSMPSLKLHFVESPSPALATDVLRGALDCAIIAGVTPDERVFRGQILRETMMLVVKPESPLAERGEIRLAELERLDLALPGPSEGVPIELEKQAFQARARISSRCEVDSADVAKQLVLGSSFATILPPLAFREEAMKGQLVGIPIVDPEIERFVMFTVQPNWSIPRTVYFEIERILFEEWIASVESGDWPAEWLMDRKRLHASEQP